MVFFAALRDRRGVAAAGDVGRRRLRRRTVVAGEHRSGSPRNRGDGGPDGRRPAAADHDDDDRPAGQRAAGHVRVRRRHPLRGRAARQARTADRATVLAPIAAVLRAPTSRWATSRPRSPKAGDPAPKEFTFRAPADRRSLRWRRRGIDVASMANNHGMDYGAGRAPGLPRRARRASGFPLIGIGHNATEAYAPFRTTIKGQRIAVIGATQVLDDNLITAWTATDTQAGLASAKDVPRLVAAVAEARADERHRRRVPALGHRDADVPERERSRSSRASSSTPVPTSWSAVTRTGSRAAGAWTPRSSATASAISRSTRAVVRARRRA